MRSLEGRYAGGDAAIAHALHKLQRRAVRLQAAVEYATQLGLEVAESSIDSRLQTVAARALRALSVRRAAIEEELLPVFELERHEHAHAWHEALGGLQAIIAQLEFATDRRDAARRYTEEIDACLAVCARVDQLLAGFLGRLDAAHAQRNGLEKLSDGLRAARSQHLGITLESFFSRLHETVAPVHEILRRGRLGIEYELAWTGGPERIAELRQQLATIDELVRALSEASLQLVAGRQDRCIVA